MRLKVAFFSWLNLTSINTKNKRNLICKWTFCCVPEKEKEAFSHTNATNGCKTLVENGTYLIAVAMQYP